MVGNTIASGARYTLVFALALGLSSCGPKIPEHDGHRYSKPWKKAKTVQFDEDKEAIIDGTVSYPKHRRVRWYEIDLPGDGELTFKMEITPLAGTRQDLALGFEVLDKGFNLVTRKYPDPEPGDDQPTAAKSKKSKKSKKAENGDDDDDDDDSGGDDWDDDDDEDDWGDEEEDDEVEGELEWEQTLFELPEGRYYIHIYAMGRLDEADYSLRVKYKSGQAARVSNFPNNVSYYDPLPVVPALDDAPDVDCKSCDCKHDDRCKSSCSKCERKVSRPSKFSCKTCSCSSSTCRRRCGDKCPKDEPEPAGTVSARILRFVSSGGGTLLIMNKGSTSGVEAGWSGRVIKDGKTLKGGTFKVTKVSGTTSQGVCSAPVEAVRGASTAKLSAP